MNRITKEMCIVFVKDYYKAKIWVSVILSAFVLIALWFFTREILVVGIAAIALLIFTVFIVLKIKNKIQNLQSTEFYIVEDVVRDFKKRFRSGKSFTKFDYTYHFEKYGKFVISKSLSPEINIPLHKEKHISHANVEKLSSESTNKGDMFYLLIVKEGEREKIIEAFYKYHFEPAKDEFEYADGRYFCKYQA